ncbi:GGDEF domain-containing protein [Croceicoccus naphthovorans]|uniref:GGDEF domain-containing protein n=1 Tax=Croceicoccus naphthovorans TaxID=1348774 RepID=UPI0012DFEA42|nr:GGDEF domain-containing protein [Croceicoccus naphthovorans]
MSLALIAVAAWPGSARAGEVVRASCHASTVLNAGPDHPELPPTNEWVCDNTDFADSPPVAWLFFTPTDIAGMQVTHFVTDIGRFQTMTLIAMGPDGPVRSRSYRMADVDIYANGPKFALPLPDLAGATGLVVAIEKPWTARLSTRAWLQDQHGDADSLGWSHEGMLAVAVVIGMILVSLFHHVAAYSLMRQRAALWMTATLGSLLLLTLTASGMIHFVLDLRLGTIVWLSTLALFAPACIGAGLLTHHMTDAELGENRRKLLQGGAIATFTIVTLLCLPLEPLRPLGPVVLLVLPVLLFIGAAAACAEALGNGCTRARFHMAMWGSMALVYVANASRATGLAVGSDWIDFLLFGGTMLTATFGTMAMVSNVDSIRQEKERESARLDALTNLIDLDPLTGIFNRRAFEQRFVELRSDGFHALAVVDLDHFKMVNDQFGHTTGDRVLQEVAAVLASDRDGIAFRMGGEEFVVMLRGSHIQQRAEQMRRAITIRIANEVDGIDGPITASMGLIESPPGGASTMRQLYSHADRLLYEAKYSGRNRLISERIQVFDAPARERRVQDRRQAVRP